MSAAAIRCAGLTKRYGDLVAVNNLDLEVPTGSVFGLLGPNGAGKSTTFGILCGSLKPTAGSATVLDTASHRLFGLRGQVAILPQDAHFPPQVPVLDQLSHFGRLMGLGSQPARRSAEESLDKVGLAHAAKMRGVELSHGMLKRVGLAQTLVGGPKVIFLDEPTAGLDPKSARGIKDIISELKDSCTVVLSSHNLVDVQEICTHGAILSRGLLAAAGTIEELTRRGAEITIESRPDATVPLDELRKEFGEANVDHQAQWVRIRFASSDDVAEVIARAVRIMLDANTPILGVNRGTTLEKAFLEVTA